MSKLTTTLNVKEEHLAIERSTLAILINHYDEIGVALLKLQTDDFLNADHRWLFIEIKKLVEQKHEPFDINLLAQHLQNNSQKFHKAGGMMFLDHINSSLTNKKYLNSYIKILHKVATLTKINNFLINWKVFPLNTSHDPGKILNELYEEFNSLEKFYLNDYEKIKSLYYLINKYAKDKKFLNESPNEITCSTGLINLDSKTRGLHPGDLIILAARPSMGKTALALKIALTQIKNFNKNDGDVIIFSLEMSWQQLVKRILTSHKGIFDSQNWSIDDSDDIEKFNEYLKAHNIFIDSSMDLDVNKLHLKLVNWSLKRKIKLVILDYLQLLKSIGKIDYNNRNLEVSNWTRRLKETARKLNIPMLCLSQLSRLVERREDKRPLLSDLRDSGSIEQDADLVLFLYRESYYLRNQNDKNTMFDVPSETEIIIAKQRNGPTGIVKVIFVPKEVTFFEFSINQNHE